MTDVAWRVLETALSDEPIADRRHALGAQLIDALGADSFVSYRCDTSGPYADPIAINLSADRLRAYDRHYRYVDTLTPQLFARRGACAVSLDSASHDEFSHDFLARNGMHYGMNYFAESADIGTIDLRLWRTRTAGAFTDDDVAVLRTVGDLIGRLWPRQLPGTAAALTPRERQIADLIAQGHTDREVCQHLGISAPTLRTHLVHAFTKTGTRNRAGLAAFAVRHHQK